LNTAFPVTLFWGPEFVMVYNEAYVKLIADKHPAALGAPARHVFPEAWDMIGPMMESVLDGQGATWVEDAPVPLRRHGRLEECYFTFSYSPVRREDGVIEGVLDIAAETTREVVDRRRLELLGSLRAELSELEHADEVPMRALPLLRAATADLPWVEIRVGEEAASRHLTIDETTAGLVVALPLGTAQGSLVVLLSDGHPPDERYLGFLRLIAASLGQALDRIAVREAERDVSETLQRSALTRPPEVPGLDIAVRYRPAAERAQIGGDWYDAFPLPDGRLSIVVGDVTGHDADAAAAMAQVRNLLRGVAYTLRGSPAEVLRCLDDAMQGLEIQVFATAILAHVRGTELRWCNAGHLPPVILEPDGAARLLDRKTDVLLGFGVADRRDHAVTLQPGAAIVLYTDGLIERRGISLMESMRWLVGAVEGHADLTADQLAEHIGSGLGAVEDDVALLVVRAQH
jgi:hypothetical protein